MPLFNSMMTAVSGAPQAIIEFNGGSWPGGTNIFWDHTATIVSDPDGIVIQANNNASYGGFVIERNTDFVISVLQNFSSTSNIGSIQLRNSSTVNPPTDQLLIDTVYSSGTFNNFQNTAFTSRNPTPPFQGLILCKSSLSVPGRFASVGGTLRLGLRLA